MNVVLVLADSLRADGLGCYGNPAARTPNIDALAAEGLRFETCYSTSPLCVPARSQLLSGQYCHETGNLTNPAWMYHVREIEEVDGVFLEPDVVTLPTALRAAGHYSGHLGKNHFYPRRNKMGFDHMEQCDFYGRHVYEEDDYYKFLQSRGQEHLFLDAFGRMDGPGGAVGIRRPEFGLLDRLCPYVSKLPAELQTTPWLGGRARQFIADAPADRPFFLVASFYAPHDPFCVSAPNDKLIDPDSISLPPVTETLQPSALYRGEQSLRVAVPQDLWRRNIAHYLANISLIDREVGGIVESLKSTGRYEDTLILVTSDHGDTLGEHGIWGKGLLYEDCVRVPLVCHHGGGAVATGVTHQTATLLDLFPTILAHAGAPCPQARLAGEALDLSQVASQPDERVVFGELANSAHPQFFVRRGRWKLIKLAGQELRELYDLDADPTELHDLADELPGVSAEMEKLLTDWLARESPHWRPRVDGTQIDWAKEMSLSHL